MKASATVALAGTLVYACSSSEGGSIDQHGERDARAEGSPATAGATDPDLLVAFIGDQGLGTDSVAVLQLIADEGADLVIHPGDFDYDDDPDAWDAQIDAVLGPDYPYFGAIGNHDIDQWPRYQQKLEQRLARIEGAACSGGDLGVRSACQYRGLHFILSGVGTRPFSPDVGIVDHVAYLRQTLAASESIWRICAWHKNRTDFQAGDKENEAPLAAYAACASGRAAVINAHEHSYARTLTLSDVGNEATYGATGAPDHMALSEGSTFVAVSGLAGKSLRDYSTAHDGDTWWATIYAGGKHLMNGERVTSSTYTYGALFIRFGVEGNPRRARGYFKNIAGEIVDEFTVTTE